MADGVSLNISGLQPLLAALQRLPAATETKIIRPSLRKGAEIIREQAAQNVRQVVSADATGTLADSIVVRALKGHPGAEVRYAVTIAPGKVNPKNKQRVGLYGAVLEFGKKGQPPRTFMRPAPRQAGQSAINAVAEGFDAKLDELVAETSRA